MTLWAFLFIIVYVPGWTGWAMQSGWAYICLTAPWLVGRPNLPRAIITLGLSAFGWALFSLFRLNHPWVGGEQVMQLFCIGLIAMVGSAQPNLRKIVRGLSVGVCVGVVFAAWYAWGWGSPYHDIVPTFGKPAGLFYNSIIFGDVCAFLILLCLVYADWIWIPLLALGLVLSDSRGAGLALVIGVIAWIIQDRRWAFLLLAVLAVPVGLVLSRIGVSDSLRLTVWLFTLRDFAWLGHGPGRLEEIGMLINGKIYLIEYAHNEFLNLLYEYGIGSVAFVPLALAPLIRWRTREWPAYVAWLSTACWSFPLHWPAEAFIGAMLAGHLYRGWALSWSRLLAWGSRLMAWHENWQRRPDSGWWGHLPAQPGLVEKRTS